MDKITEGIFIGDSSDAIDIEEIAKNGITAVLNVAFDLDICYFPPGEKSRGRFEFEYQKVGLVDGEGNCATTLVAASFALHQLLQRHDEVLVHCHAGASRAPAVVITYLACVLNTSFETELEFVKSKRPKVDLNDALLSLGCDALNILNS